MSGACPRHPIGPQDVTVLKSTYCAIAAALADLERAMVVAEHIASVDPPASVIVRRLHEALEPCWEMLVDVRVHVAAVLYEAGEEQMPT